MDFVWQSMNCKSRNPEAIGAFYRHPVWLLNGLFIEQHELSLEHRRQMTDYIAMLCPARIADYGGGFGTLARMLGSKLTQSEIEIIEPFPFPFGVQLTESFERLSYKPRLSGKYDLILATDVLEHVPDPLALTELLAAHLAPGGKLMLANCFYPVILCHLPETFHLRYSFTLLLRHMKLKKIAAISYAEVYAGTGNIKVTSVTRFLEKCSRLCFPIVTLLHKIWIKVKS
ncbi:MAG: class I SAM-dependent methyltransferase [Deltaproteobacteria bacterium]|nr:class I SAM-dependent methyltransferase [Deltaproteobacteria bacterium]